jgi:predicted nucleotidyltransferase
VTGPSSRLGQQIAQVVGEFDDARLSFALIGGLALAAHRVVRATSDVDLLVRAEDAPLVGRIAAKLGYRCLHESADVANYLRGDERLDVLLASRAVARGLLDSAQPRHTPFGELRVVSAEGLIAFKLQALVNDPRRTRDLEDIRELLRANRATLDLEQIRGYFQLFDREALLDELLAAP